MNFVRNWYYRLPLRWRTRLRRLFFLPADILFPPKNKAVPPRGLNFTGPGDFETIGREFFNYFVKWGNIRPESPILEIGCGMGRMALPFRDFLSPKGHYTGIDIVPEGIAWCRKNIAPGDARFTFILADIKNELYNPEGTIRSEEYNLPLPDNSQQLVFLTSVFTHLLPDSAAHYISEIHRVLVPGGRMIATFFLLNQESLGRLQHNESYFRFSHHSAQYATIHKGLPESNIAYEETFLLKILDDTGLRLCAPIQYGKWCGRADFLSFQDLLVAEKVNS